jgi:arylformamidase
MRIYDVTVSISNETPVYPGDPKIEIVRTAKLESGDIANVSHLSFSSHTGTHVDPPSHFVRGGRALDELSLDVLIGRARVIDVGEVSVIDSKVVESASLDGVTRVLFKTRNSRFWGDEDVKEFVKNFVYLYESAARALVEQGIKLVGIDYLSVEKFNFDTPSAHIELLGADVIIVEGLDLSSVTPGDYELICLPLKIRDGDGAPARVVLREISP